MRSIERGLICGVALLVATAGCSAGHSSHPAAAAKLTTTTLVTAAAPALTARQLDAHLGVGTPKGWDPVDGGNARVWVPHSWSFNSWGTCDGTPSTFAATSPTPAPRNDAGYLPRLPQAHCAPRRQFVVANQGFEFVALSTKPRARPTLTIHGFHLYLTHRAAPGAPWTAYDVPQLDAQVAKYGPLGRRILETLGPSTRLVALSRAYPTAPAVSRPVNAVGVSLTLPRTWRIAAPSPVADCTTNPADGRAAIELTVMKHIDQPFDPMGGTGPSLGPQNGPGCPPGPPVPPTTEAGGMAPEDGGTLYEWAGDDPTNQWYHSVEPGLATTPGEPVATLRHSTTTITIWAGPYAPNTLDLFIHRDGSAITHALTLDLGRDGRVAGRVIASIQATS